MEYKVTKNAEKNLYIMTKDVMVANDGFIDEYGSGLYTKKVNQQELTEYYYIEPGAVYKGQSFDVIQNLINGKIILGTNDTILAEKFKFKRTDKYYYELDVAMEDVIITENRREIK